MKFIRKILVKVFGLKGYLRLVSKVYIICISYGLMRKKYSELFFIKKLVKPGDHVLDIGANLAYYSFFMTVSAGKKGKLIAVEPIPLFAEVWKKNMRSLKGYDYTLVNCALGNEPKEKVKMSIPIVDGIVRHGLTKVVDTSTTLSTSENDSNSTVALSFEVPMKNGDSLMQELKIDRLDFIKCDVEGFEQYVIPSLSTTIQQQLPILQIELSGNENRSAVADFLVNLSYDIFILKDDLLNSIQKNDIFSINQDFYFIHQTKIEQSKYLIKH